jgi:acyl-CoA hydrolase
MDIEKRVEESITEQIQLVMPEHINGSGRLFGGKLMEWIDVVASVVAKRHSQCNVTTAAIDNLQFKAAAHLNDTLVLVGRLTYVGTSSMEIRVDTYVESMDGMRKPINRAYLVMVAIDEEERPIKVPRIKVATESQRAEWEGGKKRTELRKLRRKEGF